MKSSYITQWGSDTIEIRADFTLSGSQVEGTNGRKVADFKHNPKAAMRYALEREAIAEGLDTSDDDVAELIDEALEGMSEA